MSAGASSIGSLIAPARMVASAGDESARWTKRTGWLLVTLLVVRLIYVVLRPFELVPDEAYYWDWSRILDVGYYSKPPMVAWLIAASTSLVGNSEAGVRLPAAILGTLGLLPLFWLTLAMFSARAGFWAVAAAAATPGLTALATLMTIDAPFLCAWTFAAWSVWKLIESPQPRWKWVVAATVATGLGLLSKQTMLGLPVLVTVFLLTDSSRRNLLWSKAYLGWVIGSLLFLVPVVLWNARHDWVTVEHTREHFGAAAVSLARRGTWFAEYLGGQMGVLSPILGVMMLGVAIGGTLCWSRLRASERFLLILGPLPWLPVAGLALMQRVQPNWPAAFHVTGLILLAGWCTGDGFPWRRGRVQQDANWFRGGVLLGGLLSLMVLIVPAIVPRTPLAGTAIDPTTRLRGWDSLADQLNELARTSGDPDCLYICATSRGPVSEFAYYLPKQPRVYRWNVGEVIDSQHDLWDGPKPGERFRAILVTHADHAVPDKLAASFQTMSPLGRISCRLGQNRALEFEVWEGRGFREWPVSAARQELADKTRKVLGSNQLTAGQSPSRN